MAQFDVPVRQAPPHSPPEAPPSEVALRLRLARSSIVTKLVLALMLLTLTGAAGGFYAVTRLVQLDGLYSRLIDQQARGALLVTRAALSIVDDARLLQRLLNEPDRGVQERLLGERDAAQRRVLQILGAAEAALPSEAARIRSFTEEFGALLETARLVENAAQSHDILMALHIHRLDFQPQFTALRAQMRGLVFNLDRAVLDGSARLTAQSKRTMQRTLLIIGLSAALSLFMAVWPVRRGVTLPVKRITTRMNMLQAGDKLAPVPDLDRRDEIGRMASALESFRLAAIQQDHLDHQANTDGLTGLLNRRASMSVLARLMEGGTPVAAVAIDLDHFKDTNDTHGHAAGDALLCATAERLRAVVRSGDVVGRLGGDEFVAFLLGPETRAELERVAARIRDALHQPVPHAGLSLRLGATLGVAFTPPEAQTPQAVLAAADEALILAKRRRRGSIGWAQGLAA
jgi:diguanylate cyclase (GGDEF)-like protein